MERRKPGNIISVGRSGRKEKERQELGKAKDKEREPEGKREGMRRKRRKEKYEQ